MPDHRDPVDLQDAQEVAHAVGEAGDRVVGPRLLGPPLAEKIPNLRRYEHGKALGTPDGSEAPYYYVADLSFDDPDALQAGLSSPEGQAAAGDLANFASGGVTMFVAQV